MHDLGRLPVRTLCVAVVEFNRSQLANQAAKRRLLCLGHA